MSILKSPFLPHKFTTFCQRYAGICVKHLCKTHLKQVYKHHLSSCPRRKGNILPCSSEILHNVTPVTYQYNVCYKATSSVQQPRNLQNHKTTVKGLKSKSIISEYFEKEQVQDSPSDDDCKKIYEELEELWTDADTGSLDLAVKQESQGLVHPHSLRNKHNSIETYDLFSGPDPTIPMSDIPCPGCGAFLHCQDPGIPGYVPNQRYLSAFPKKLQLTHCQRCLLLRDHNLALNLSVPPEKYREIIAQVKDVFALILVVVDIMDLPNSIFPNLSEVVGKKRPLYIVGNKVDQLPRDEHGYLERAKASLLQHCEEAGLTTDNPVKHTCLISAKTGYGVEDLVTRLISDWARKGHVYILGCTNVGKSSLFNVLLSSDYCRSSARHFINRATTSTWPGTTLNLLKFPILDPAPWRLHQRRQRLKKQRTIEAEEQMLKQRNQRGNEKLKHATLWGHVGQTFVSSVQSELHLKALDNMPSVPAYGMGHGGFSEMKRRKPDLDMKFDESVYAKSRFCFDTPGVVNPEQLINYLTQKELSVLLTEKKVKPRTFCVKPGYVLFVTGMARLDYTKGDRSVYFTVITNSNLPVYVLPYKEADEFYMKSIGTEDLLLPLGDVERRNKLPSLVGKEFTVTGTSWQKSSADVLLSSLGWVSVTAGAEMTVTLRGYTPGGVGCRLRQPALLPYAVNTRGHRIRRTPAFEEIEETVEQ